MCRRAQPFYKTPKVDRRFELVKIALDQDLRYRGIHYRCEEVATRAVALADAVLAKMDKDNEKGNT